MTTYIGVSKNDYQAEDRSWLLSQFGQGPGENPSVLLDISAFTKATHYPNGYIKSGEPLGVITASSSGEQLVVGPYDGAAVDGRETCYGFLHSAISVPDVNDNTKDVGGAAVVAGFIKLSRLPRTLDAAGQADLKLCHFTA
jgi:hypothetical protein